jgi:hypothetical protein
MKEQRMSESKPEGYQKVLSLSLSAINPGEVPDEKSLMDTLQVLRRLAPGLTDAHIQDIFGEITSILSVRMDLGVLVEAPGHKPWLFERNVEWRLWHAYRQWLASEGRGPVVLDTLNETLNTILDRMGDPKQEGSWKRRGLVIGDVQSGKTGTYIGLMDKAIDVGYHVVILLTGNTEPLRRQTQERVDQGVTGRDSTKTGPQKRTRTLVGIGPLLDSTASVDSMTTMHTDFRRNSLEAIDTVLGPNKTVIFVTKKNKTVLGRIHDWLENNREGESKIKLPLLLIDDEADFYSINTSTPDDDPTAINKKIREILDLFSRNCYVGFTATPFANIFIDDNAEGDLFPSDFIFGLNAPSNYIGPNKLFGQEEFDPSIHIVSDAEVAFPLRHQSHLEFSELPDSLFDAIRTYLLTNAIRDLRGQRGERTSMLINVSRFVNVQRRLFERVHHVVAEFKNAIELNSVAYLKGTPHLLLSEIEQTFRNEFADCEFSWQDVLAELANANAAVRVVEQNSRAEKLEATPLRHISIGGNILSRGLTLEGLSTSYFYRNAGAADTLMQMGRWFGYRDGYEDLCRLWMTENMAEAFSHVAETLEQLRLELAEMKAQNLTPEQYGLAVRLHPDALMITARNKMRAARRGRKSISLRGEAHETRALPTNKKSLEANWNATVEFLESVTAELGDAELVGRARRHVWRGIDKETVADLLSAFQVAPSRSTGIFQEDALAKFVRRAVADDLQAWDVVLMGGASKRKADIPGAVGAYRFPERTFGGGPTVGAWKVSDTKFRVAGPGDVATTMTEETKKFVRDRYQIETGKDVVPDWGYARELKNPVLIVYPLFPRATGLDPGLDCPIVALSVVVPGVKQKESDNVEYLLNTPAQRLFVSELEDITIDDEDDFS